jgi:hypothetical protein
VGMRPSSSMSCALRSGRERSMSSSCLHGAVPPHVRRRHACNIKRLLPASEAFRIARASMSSADAPEPAVDRIMRRLDGGNAGFRATACGASCSNEVYSRACSDCFHARGAPALRPRLRRWARRAGMRCAHAFRCAC